MTPTVVKLGGSLAFSPLLRRWLGAIAAAAGQVVVVPGGGPFAEAVRRTQPRMGFDDRAAHDMALLAMGQFGIALAGLGRDLGLVPAESTSEIERLLAKRRVPVWSPYAMLRDAPNVPPCWAVTSDSLALWLAAAIGAPQVLLVKAARVPPVSSIAKLVAAGLVDQAAPEFLARFAGTLSVASVDDVPRTVLDVRRLPGIGVRALA